MPSTGNKNRNKKQSGTDKYRGAELAKIHIARKDLGLDEDIYRDIIRVASGGKTESAGGLDWSGRRAVLDRFRELGWKDKPSTKAKSGRRLADDPQSRMLRGLWIELHKAGKVSDPSEAALCKFVKRVTGKDALQWLNNQDVTKVKTALTSWLER